MKKRLLLLILVFSVCYSCRMDKTPSGDFTIHRGLNISHWLSQSDRRGEERKAFFTENDVKFIAGIGYDHIRLPIDEVQMWDENGEKYQDAFALLHDAVSWCSAQGLRVIVDLHIIRSHYFNSDERPLWTHPEEQAKFIQLWRDLSMELIQYPDSLVAYELMNEAVADNPDDWNNLIDSTINALRETEPHRKIVIGSNMWQSVGTFNDLRIPDDPDLILSFHFYHPMVLTHYHASWTKVGEYTGPVTYPGKVVPEKNIENLPEDLRKEVEYWGRNYNIDSMRVEVNKPLMYAREHHLPLYCGEFGCLNTVPEDIRLRWYGDFIKVLDEDGIAWANWDYRGGFGIVDAAGKPNQALIDRLLK